MAINKATTQGQKHSISAESALGTATGSSWDWRPDTFDFPTEQSATYQPMSGGHTNPADANKVIPYKSGDQTGTLSALVRRATGTNEPTLGFLLKAGGWTMAELSGATTVATLTVPGSLIFTADVGAENGSFVLVETTTDVFEPVQIAAWTVGTTTGVPVFEMTADPTDLDKIEQMYTYYPQSGTLGAAESLQFIHLSRVEDGASNPQEWTYKGCACILKTITITPNEPLKFEFEVLIAGTTMADGTWSVESDHEVVGVCMANNDFKMLIGDTIASGAGGIARTPIGIRSVVIETGITAEKITSVGGSTDINSVGGYVIKLAQPTWTVEGWFDVDSWTDYETEFVGGSGTNPDTALMACFSSQDYLLYPGVGISSPRCNLIEAPTAALKDTESGLVEGTLKFGANAAELNAQDGPTDAADQAIYIGISGTAP
jgi:hypothetical protein